MSTTVIDGERLGKPPALNLSGRIPELDGLRGFAIGMVVVWHYFVLTVQARPASPLAYFMALFRLTWSGVDLFFVLSGFLIGGILLDARKATNYFQVFYKRRFFRIVPIYTAFLLAIAVMNFTVERIHYTGFTWLTQDSLPWYSFWTFTQNFWAAHSVAPNAVALAVTWSLAVEEQFYLTLPLIVRFFAGRRLLVCVLAGICMAPMSRVAIRFFWPHNWAAGFCLMPCRADALLLGVLAAILVRDSTWRNRIQTNRLFFAISMPMFLLGIAFLNLKAPSMENPLMQSLGYTSLALFYVSVLLYSVTRPGSLVSRCLRFKWLGWLGGIAYGTYLFHQFILGISPSHFWGGYPKIQDGPTLLVALESLALTLIVARLSWRYFEGPLIRFGHGSSYRFGESVSKPVSRSEPEVVRP
jgi:peptidoglycan/LPS O-acetylase OafA/YrhL